MRDLDMISVRLFLKVCEYASISKAAVAEHIAPSAISKRLALLEHALGAPLLVRGRRGVQPTAAGEVVLEHARTLQFTMGRIESDVAALHGGVRGHVRLLATTSALAESLLDDLALFMRDPAHALIKVDIEERVTVDVLRVLREGSSGVGVCWHNPSLGGYDGLELRDYRRDQLGIAVHRDHPLAKRKSLRVIDTVDYEHVALPPSASITINTQREAARAGKTVQFRAIVSNMDAVFRVVAANLAVGVIPLQVNLPQSAIDTVKIIPLREAWASRKFTICFRNFDQLQPASQRLVEHLEVHARGQRDQV